MKLKGLDKVLIFMFILLNWMLLSQYAEIGLIIQENCGTMKNYCFQNVLSQFRSMKSKLMALELPFKIRITFRLNLKNYAKKVSLLFIIASNF